MIDFSKIDLSTIEPQKTDVLYKSVEVTSKGECMGEFTYYASGTLYTTNSGNKFWDNIFIQMSHPNMGIGWEFSVKRDHANRVKNKQMELYVFAEEVLNKTLNQHTEQNEK
jgi:hypothetical protein